MIILMDTADEYIKKHSCCDCGKFPINRGAKRCPPCEWARKKRELRVRVSKPCPVCGSPITGRTRQVRRRETCSRVCSGKLKWMRRKEEVRKSLEP